MRLSFKFIDEWLAPWREYFAEFLGVVFLVFLSSSVVVVDRIYTDIGIVGVALAFGFIYAVISFATTQISGGFLNPVVSLTLWLCRKLSGAKLFFYLVAQIFGSLVGALIVFLVFGPATFGMNLGGPEIGLGVTFQTALILEAVLSAGLVFVFSATLFNKGHFANLAPFVLGLYIAVVSMIALPITGAVINPVRAIGPLVFSKSYASIAVFIIGPLFSSLVGIAYAFIFLKQKDKNS